MIGHLWSHLIFCAAAYTVLPFQYSDDYFLYLDYLSPRAEETVILGFVLFIIGVLLVTIPELFPHFLNLSSPPPFGFILGILGIVLGTIGLGTIVVKNIEKNEDK